MASPVQSPFTNKDIHTSLSILVSSPITEPNYYSRGLNGDSYYSSPISPPPPPPTGPHPNIAGFNTLTLDIDVHPNQKYSESITPKTPITEITMDNTEQTPTPHNTEHSEHSEHSEQSEQTPTPHNTEQSEQTPTPTSTPTDNNSDIISVTGLVDDNIINTTESEYIEKLSISNLRGFGNIGIQVNPETNDKQLSPITFDGVEYISSPPKIHYDDKETNTEEDFRIGVVMRNMDVTKEEAEEFINSDENEENLCPLIKRNYDSYDEVFSHDITTCDKNASSIEDREKVIEEYEVKLNELTLEIYEKQNRLDEIESSLKKRESRIEIMENKFVTSVFDNVFHLSVVIFIGYASYKVVSVVF